jgi:uncharacterized protein
VAFLDSVFAKKSQSKVARLNSDAADGRNDARTARREQIEVSVFLFLIVPSMALSFFVVKQGRLSFELVAYATILRDLSLVSLILFFIWRNKESLQRIGWSLKNGPKEIGLGIGLFLPFFLGAGLVESALRAAGFSAPSTPAPSFLTAKGLAEFLLAFVLVTVVALAEETIFRGYLILRLKAVMKNPVAGALLSAALFSIGHGYEGSAGVVTVGFMGVALAFVYLWRQSLVAPMVIHFLQDLTSMILAPLLAR